MEKVMSVEEKIRRAEEIYNRRNGNNYTYLYKKEKEKKAPSLTYRLVKQIIICFIIYGIFYVVQNREYFMSNDFRIKVQEIVSQNENIEKVYNNAMSYIQKYIPSLQEQTQSENGNENTTLQNTNEENNVSENIVSENNQNESIGGAEENIPVEQESVQKTQEEIDVENIKSTISFIKPIEGTISSTFGWRNPTTATVPKYHTGLDIATKMGTKIKSATEGKVILASSEGDYGNHYKIQVNDVVIIYAHCSKLYLKEGDNVTQGQEIAEVGSTRKFYTDHIYILK